MFLGGGAVKYPDHKHNKKSRYMMTKSLNLLTILFTSIKIHYNVPVITINRYFYFVLFFPFVLFVFVVFVLNFLFVRVLLVFLLRKRQKDCVCHPPTYPIAYVSLAF